MRTLKLTIAYDGTRYAGWQIQNHRRQKAVSRRQKPQQPTIQGTLEQVLQRILHEPVRVVGSGRTDAGVHALAQVAHVRTRSPIPCGRLLRALDHLLPDAIAVSHIEDVAPTFHARFSARAKRYRYRAFTGAVVPPFIRPYVHHVRARLNVALMRREADELRGRHDFRAFAHVGSAGATTRTIYAIALRRRGQELHLDVEGNGFLRTMVRSLAGTLIDIGRGHLPTGTVHRMLARQTRHLAGTTAPASGLSLVSVSYGDPRPSSIPSVGQFYLPSGRTRRKRRNGRN